MPKQCPMTGEPCDRADCASGTEFQCGAQAFAKPDVQVIIIERPPAGPETYLGDGLYVSFDGGMLKLRAPRERGDHEVYLEPEAFHQLIEFVKRTPLRVLVR